MSAKDAIVRTAQGPMRNGVLLVTPERAREEGRCCCSGCDSCVAGNGSACGLAGIAGEYCTWCTRSRSRAR